MRVGGLEVALLDGPVGENTTVSLCSLVVIAEGGSKQAYDGGK